MLRPHVWLHCGFGLQPATVALRSSTQERYSVPLGVEVRRGNDTEHFAVEPASVPPQAPLASLSSTRTVEACGVQEPAAAPSAVHVPDARAHEPALRIDGFPSVVWPRPSWNTTVILLLLSIARSAVPPHHPAGWPPVEAIPAPGYVGPSGAV